MADRVEGDGDEYAVERLVKAAGRRSEMPENMRRGWEEHFRAELNQARSARSQRGWRMVASLALGGVLIAAVAMTWNAGNTPAPAPTMLASIDQVVDSVYTINAEQGRTETRSSAGLFAGDRLDTSAKGLVSVEYRGAHLRLDRNSALAFAHDEIELLRGQLYIDSQGGSGLAESLRLRAGDVTVRHIGTQYLVRREVNSVTSTVREGRIEVSVGEHQVEVRAESGSGVAKRVRVGIDAVPVTSAVQAGDEWNWIYAVAPRFSLEGSTHAELLQWLSRETGLQLIYADAPTREHATQHRFAGMDYPDLPPMEALELLLSSTRLDATTDATRLVVRLRNGAGG